MQSLTLLTSDLQYTQQREHSKTMSSNPWYMRNNLLELANIIFPSKNSATVPKTAKHLTCETLKTG